MNPVQRLIKAAGGNKAVSAVIGGDPATIWRKAGFGGADFTDKEIAAICKMTDGLIKPENVRKK